MPGQTARDFPRNSLGSTYSVHAIGRAFDLLRSFTPLAPEHSLGWLSREAKLPRSTTHRLLVSLVRGGLVEHCPESGGVYRLGREALRLGNVVQSQIRPEDTVFHTMRDLSVRFDETVGLAALVDGEVLILERVEGSGPFRRAYSVGARVPARSTASGRVLLSQLSREERENFLTESQQGILAPEERSALRLDLEEVRAAGFAIDRGSYIQGLTCIAVPVRTPVDVTLSLAVSGPAARMQSLLSAKTLAVLQEVARGVGKARGLTPLLQHAR